MSGKTDLSDYLRDTYGECVAGKCRCRDPGPWLGVLCQHWRSWGVRDWDQLARRQALSRFPKDEG